MPLLTFDQTCWLGKTPLHWHVAILTGNCVLTSCYHKLWAMLQGINCWVSCKPILTKLAASKMKNISSILYYIGLYVCIIMLCVCITLHKLYKQLRLLQLLLPDCIYFSCCSLITSTSAAASSLCSLQLLHPDCTHLNCWSPIASSSAATPGLDLLQLLLHDCVHFCCSTSQIFSILASPLLHPLQLFLPNCVCLGCCSLTVSASAAAPQLSELWLLHDCTRLWTHACNTK